MYAITFLGRLFKQEESALTSTQSSRDDMEEGIFATG